VNAKKVVTLEISGKIIEILELKSGKSANGEWRKQEYVLETEAQYPKKVCFMAWGDKIDQFNIQQGETVAVSIDLESREYNGRWYTDVKAWKVSRIEVPRYLIEQADVCTVVITAPTSQLFSSD